MRVCFLVRKLLLDYKQLSNQTLHRPLKVLIYITHYHVLLLPRRNRLKWPTGSIYALITLFKRTVSFFYFTTVTSNLYLRKVELRMRFCDVKMTLCCMATGLITLFWAFIHIYLIKASYVIFNLQKPNDTHLAGAKMPVFNHTNAIFATFFSVIKSIGLPTAQTDQTTL